MLLCSILQASVRKSSHGLLHILQNQLTAVIQAATIEVGSCTAAILWLADIAVHIVDVYLFVVLLLRFLLLILFSRLLTGYFVVYFFFVVPIAVSCDKEILFGLLLGWWKLKRACERLSLVLKWPRLEQLSVICSVSCLF